MKLLILLLCASLCTAMCGAADFLYDCRSDIRPEPGSNVVLFDGIAHNEIRQYFIPTLPTLNFVQMYVSDAAGSNGRGATMFLEIRDGSQDTVVGISEPMTFGDLYGGFAQFTFSTPIPLALKTRFAIAPKLVDYIRDPITSDFVQSDPWNIQSVGGFGQGAAGLWINNELKGGYSLLFREGVTIPEPSVSHLIILTAICFAISLVCRYRP